MHLTHPANASPDSTFESHSASAKLPSGGQMTVRNFAGLPLFDKLNAGIGSDGWRQAGNSQTASQWA